MIIQPRSPLSVRHTMSLPVPAQSLSTLEGVCPLPYLGVIQARGEDAASFLHNQLTNDVLLLPVGQARLAAFCNAKGRMQASFVLIKTAPDTVLLVMPQALLGRTLKRLSMFVLRAKVQLSDASGQWQLRGLLGRSASALAGDTAPWHAAQRDSAHVVTLYPAVLQQDAHRVQLPRGLWLAAAAVGLPEGPALELQTWHWSEVLAAVPLLDEALFEAFVPQMLNYESVGGVNFKKGCYPGQEVVARSQFRGTLKRRMARVFSKVDLQPGQDVFSPADPEQPCASVVACAARPDGSGFDALVSGTLESMSQGWRAGSAQGAPLDLLPLPYALLEDI